MSKAISEKEREIPESLRKQLEDFRKHLWRRKVMESVAAGVIGLLVSFLLIFGLDRVYATPGWARLLILLGGVSLFAGFAPYWLHRWIWGHRREDQLARLIARRYPGLGDRLLGVIELQGQHESGDTMSPRLRAAAMEVVAAEAGKRNLDDALPVPRHRKWALVALMLTMVATAGFLMAPKAGLNALQRWLNPFSEVERYTFTQLESPVNYQAVPWGESFEIVLKLGENSERQPQFGVANLGTQPEVTAELGRGEYVFRFPGQQEKGVVTFRIGDMKHEVHIEPLRRPSVTATRVKVKTPSYMEIPEREVEMSIGEISVVEGSEMVFTLETSRALKEGKYGPTEISGETVESAGFESMEGDLEISGRNAMTGKLVAGVVPFSVPFEWRDEFGLSGGQNFNLRVDAVRDEAPAAYTQGLDKQKAILPEETLDFEVMCEDDFGLKIAGVEWSSVGTLPGQTEAQAGELIVSRGGPEEQRITGPVAFSPAAFGIGPQRLILRAFAEDYYPGRGRVYSEPVLVFVLTREEHAQVMKAEFDRVISELEDSARKELNLLDENQRLERLEGEELQGEEGKKRLEEQEKQEAENAEKMEELKQRMEKLMKDAARNGEIDKETMKKMAESLKSMQELAEKDMPEVQKELAEAGEPSNTSEKAKEHMEEAVEKQKEVVKKMQKAVEQANEANKRFEASTFVARLKKAASDENGILATVKAKLAGSDILGVHQQFVDPKDIRELGDSAGVQMQIGADVRWIQEDMGHYNARTGQEVFMKILDLMRESKIDIGLEEVRGKLDKNHIHTAGEEAEQWAKKLSEWAALLGEEMNKNSQGQEGEGGPPDSEDEDFEFMLRVMKMIQTQQDLRDRTRVLEQLKRDANLKKED
jgi:hypothetical protein